MNEQIIEGSHKIDDVLKTTNSTNVFDYEIDTLGETLSKRLILDLHRMSKERTLGYKRGFAGC